MKSRSGALLLISTDYEEFKNGGTRCCEDDPEPSWPNASPLCSVYSEPGKPIVQ